MLNKKLLLLIIVGMFLISWVSALDDLPPAKLNQEYIIKQTCATCSYVNISVSNLNGFVLNNVEMTNNGSGVWVYDYTPTTIGRHDVIGKGDLGGTDTSFATYFEVTTNGKTEADGILIVFYTLIFIALFIFGLFSFFNALQNFMSFEMDLKDTIMMIGGYLGMWMFYYFSQEYLGNGFINDILEIAIDIGSITHVFLPLIGLMVSMIMTNMKFKQKARTTY